MSTPIPKRGDAAPHFWGTLAGGNAAIKAKLRTSSIRLIRKMTRSKVSDCLENGSTQKNGAKNGTVFYFKLQNTSQSVQPLLA